MRIYHWRPSHHRLADGSSDWSSPHWELQKCLPDCPLLEDSGQGGPFYDYRENEQEAPSEPGLRNVRFNSETKELILNWSFSYGIVSKDAKPQLLFGNLGEHLYGGHFDNRHNTLPTNLYYGMADRGGISYFAVVEEEEDENRTL